MKIVVDENIPAISVEWLRNGGHDVIDIRGTAEQGANDQGVWQAAQRERALLITTDSGFQQNRDLPHFGIFIVCLRQPNELLIHNRITRGMKRYKPEDWPNLTVRMRDRVIRAWRNRHSRK